VQQNSLPFTNIRRHAMQLYSVAVRATTKTRCVTMIRPNILENNESHEERT